MAKLKRQRKKQKGVVDKYCIGCRYLCDLTWGESPEGPDRCCCCDYICQTGKRRPCPAGSGCTVRETRFARGDVRRRKITFGKAGTPSAFGGTAADRRNKKEENHERKQY